MKTILNGSWLAFLLLSTPGLMAQNTNQNFSWTVIGTGTETWNVMNYNTAELTVWSADYPGLNPAADSVTVTAGLTGKANFSASLDSSFGGTTYASISPSIWSDETDTGVLRADNGTFEATAGTTYTLYGGVNK
jgi:hypothetical protein